jgi:hypothetical protein
MLAGQTASMTVTTADGQGYTVVWGDGSTTFGASGSTITHVYTAGFTGNVQITGTAAASTSDLQAPAATGQYAPLHMTAGAGESVNLTVTTGDGSNYIVDWGDGNISFFLSNTAATHTYGAAFSGDVIVTSTSDMATMFHTSGGWDYNLIDLPRTITQYATIGGAVSGQLANLPPNVDSFNLGVGNTVAGSISDIPSLVTSAIMSGSNTITVGVGEVWGGATSLVRQVYFDSTVAKTVAELDNLLATLDAAISSWTASKLVDLNAANNPTPTNTGAITSIQSKGVNVLTN